VTTYNEHPQEVHARKIEEIAARIENEMAILRREVRLFLEHDPEVHGTLDVKEEAPSPLVVEPPLDRASASAAASTRRATLLTREFKPSKYGYISAHFAAEYPGLNPQDVLEGFLSWYIAKGDTSRNWLEKFWQYARGAEQRMKDGKTRDEFAWIDAAERHAREIAKVEAEYEAQERAGEQA
jgi:hypothetical protein